MRVAVVGLGEGALMFGFQPVVELHLGARDQLVDDTFNIHARRELFDHADHAPQGLQIGSQRLVSAGVLDLDGNLPAVRPHAFVHLADAGRGHRGVVELGKPLTPFGAQLRVEHPMHLVGG